MKNRNFFIIKFFLVVALLLVSIQLFSSEVKALAPPPGMPSNTLPNNGLALDAKEYSPWLVVTAPGTNGMKGPYSTTYAYWPYSATSTTGNSVSLIFRDACDTTANDESGGNQNTLFSVNNVDAAKTKISPTTTPLTIPVSTTSQFECTSGTDVTVTITPTIATTTVQIRGTKYYRVTVIAKLKNITGTSYYVNRYRTEIINSKGYVGYADNLGSTDDSRLTGIAYNNYSGSAWGWQTRLAFATPCGANKSGEIEFFDSDHDPSNTGTTLAPARWQNQTNKMQYIIQSYNRLTNAFVENVVVGSTAGWKDLTGGNNVKDSASPVLTFNKDYIYVLIVRGINAQNSLQISLPFDQMYATDTCANDVKCVMSLKNPTVTAGGETEVIATIINQTGVDWVYDPLQTNWGTSNYTLGVVDASTTYYKYNYPEYSTPGPAPDTDNANFVLPYDGINTSFYSLTPTFNIYRFGMKKTVEAGQSQTFSFKITAPAEGVTRKVGVRILDRARQLNGVVAWLDWNDVCVINVTPDRPPVVEITSATCQKLEGFAYDPDNGSSLTVIIYKGDPASGGTIYDTVVANTPRSTAPIGNYGFSVNISGVQATYYVVALGINKSGAPNNVNTTVSKQSGQCSYSCTFTSPIDGSMSEPGETITPVMKITRDDTSSTETMDITPSAIINGTAITPTPSKVTLDSTSAIAFVNFTGKTYIIADTDPGSFTVSGSISWPGGNKNCDNVKFNIVKKPFFTVTKGDLSVGGGYDSGCTAAGSGNVYSWADTNTPGAYKGANSTHVAKVFGTAKDFYTGSKFTGASQKYLTLSNSDTTKPWGGGFGAGTCMTDLYSTKNTDVATWSNGFDSVQTLQNNSIKNQIEYTAGDFTLSGISDFTGRLAIYIEKNVFITSNITNSTIGYTVDTSTGKLNVPFFALIVQGNIYIGPNVTQLDGIYSAGGTIYTCTLGPESNWDNTGPSDLYKNCQKPLTFNGIVQAKSIKLRRVNGTLRDNTPAETFNGLPELYLAKTPFVDNTPSSTKYDSASLLPPLL